MKVRWFLFLFCFLVILVASGFGIENKFGWGKVIYLANEWRNDVFLGKGGLNKFRKAEVFGTDQYSENRYGQYGFLLAIKGNDIWLLTIDGVKHFTPASDNLDDVYLLSLDSCTEKEAIESIIQEDGGIQLMETRYGRMNELNLVIKANSLKIINISYLVEDEKKSVKRYRYVHVLNGLPYENQIGIVCLN